MRIPYMFQNLSTNPLLYQALAPRQTTIDAGNTTLIPTGALPPSQALCDSPIYCPGPLLQAVQLAGIYPDSKTFVDKPTLKPQEDVLSAFAALGDGQGNNITYGQLKTFLDENFGEEGTELVDADLGEQFVDSPDFLDELEDVVVRKWMKQVHGYWPLLARSVNSSSPSGTQCDGCVSSFLPFKEARTIVVPGGRFRELYYWDTYFVILGLLVSNLTDVAKGLLENFGDLIELYGFIPNGNRVYYLNRSQPPLFTQMVKVYVDATGDYSVLERLLPLLDQEHQWWTTNRTIEVNGYYSGKRHQLTHYKVNTDAPRPESYLEDYDTVVFANASGLDLNKTQRSQLYSDIASGAESGHDFSAVRWSKEPLIDTEDTIPAQRFLNTAAIVPVDLNAILYKNEVVLAEFHNRTVKASKNMTDGSSTGLQANATAAKLWAERAQRRKDAILDVHWCKERKWFYDYNTTAEARSPYWSAAGIFAYWAQIIPTEFLNSKTPLKQRAAGLQESWAGVRYLLDRYNGSLSTTLLETGQQWDFPNHWAPYTEIAIDALTNFPGDLAGTGSLKPAPNGSYALIPPKQLGTDPADLPAQTIVGTNDTVYSSLEAIGQTSSNSGLEPLIDPPNVGKSQSNESWAESLIRITANRYISSALCTWHSTGGMLNLTDSQDPEGLWDPEPTTTLEAEGLPTNSTGLISEKFSQLSASQLGGGGEYTVQIGFGWSNGVALRLGGLYPKLLERPVCPPLDLSEF